MSLVELNDKINHYLSDIKYNKNKIVLYGEIYSKKNSKMFFKNKKTGRMFIASNSNVRNKEKDILTQLLQKDNIEKWLKQIDNKVYPIVVAFKFYRKTSRQFDYNNMSQIVADAMIKANYIKDDSMLYFIPDFKTFQWEKDKQNPRTEIFVL